MVYSKFKRFNIFEIVTRIAKDETGKVINSTSSYSRESFDQFHFKIF